jgi:hypothetical protein
MSRAPASPTAAGEMQRPYSHDPVVAPPSVGPLALPSRHDDPSQPQFVPMMHWLQFVLMLHGHVVPPEKYHVPTSPPPVGPVAEPGLQSPEPESQPHPKSSVQPPQLVELAQEDAPELEAWEAASDALSTAAMIARAIDARMIEARRWVEG